MNLGELVTRNARKFPEKEALVFDDKRHTHSELNNLINSLANALLETGIKKGDKVAMMMNNSDWFVITYFGVLKTGALVVPLNFRLAGPEVTYIVNNCDARTFIFDQEFLPIIDQIRAQLPRVKTYIAGGDFSSTNHTLGLKPLLRAYPKDEPGVKIQEYDESAIIYTAGTTGRPKGALFTHHNNLMTAISVLIQADTKEESRILHVAPLFHSAQLHLFLLSGTYLGAVHVVLKPFDPKEVLETIERERITIFFGVPVMFSLMMSLPDFDRYDISSLSICMYGAAPMAPETVKQAIEKFKTDQFYNLCGFTEAGPGGVILQPKDQIRKAGAAGEAPINMEARIVDGRGRDVPVGVVGEFVVRSECGMKCYYKDPEATKEAMRDGWLHSGDLGVMDDEGFITLVDRKKDMIITGGENVYSQEVEEVLSTHPKILEVAVIGIPHEVWGETVTAVVVLKPGQKLSKEELFDFCKDNLAKYKIPRILKFKDVLPRNALGKVLKRKLREEYGKGLWQRS